MFAIRRGNNEYTHHLTRQYIILSVLRHNVIFLGESRHFSIDVGLIAFVFTVLTATIGRDIYAGNADVYGGGVLDHLSADTLSLAILLGDLNELFPVYRFGMSGIRRHERSLRTVRAEVKTSYVHSE